MMRNIVRHHATVTRARREEQNSHRGAIIWFTGLSGSGKFAPEHPDLTVETGTRPLEECVRQVVDEMIHRGIVSPVKLGQDIGNQP